MSIESITNILVFLQTFMVSQHAIDDKSCFVLTGDILSKIILQ